MATKVRSLEETPTWAVAFVCFVLVAISIAIENIIHLARKWLRKRNKKALYEVLQKFKSELMVLGFISLLLTVGQGPISGICVSKVVGNSWHPCDKKQETSKFGESKENGIRWHSYLWLPFLPLIVIITKMGLRIQAERGEVVKGTPIVQPGDDLFWFNRPRLLLYLIHFVLFQNAFQLAFLAWSWYEFGIGSCFHEKREDLAIKIPMGVLVQILCSYVTLPLYALVTQMGSTMKPTVFNEGVTKTLRNWHQSARKQIKKNHHNSGSVTPLSSRPSTSVPPSSSPVQLLRYLNNEFDLSGPGSQSVSSYRTESWQHEENDFSPSSDRSRTPKNQERPMF